MVPDMLGLQQDTYVGRLPIADLVFQALEEITCSIFKVGFESPTMSVSRQKAQSVMFCTLLSSSI